MATASLPQRDWIATEFCKGIDAEQALAIGRSLDRK